MKKAGEPLPGMTALQAPLSLIRLCDCVLRAGFIPIKSVSVTEWSAQAGSHQVHHAERAARCSRKATGQRGGESGLGPPLTLAHFVSLSKSLPHPGPQPPFHRTRGYL